tara:strand:+ start:38 stop:277 length:240 start_codon:yes stop_codon:yes gene_type:complete
MDELQIAHYISTLLDEKEREVEKEQLRYNEIYRGNPENRAFIDPERMVAWGQELSWERHMIYKAQKSMDSLIKEKESIK